MKKLIEWFQMKRDLRFKKRIERYFKYNILDAGIITKGNVTAKGFYEIETKKRVRAEEKKAATPKMKKD